MQITAPDEQSRMTKLEQAFWEYHLAHPEVYVLVDKYAREAIASGLTQFSISMIIEHIRWFRMVQKKEEFKMPNAHRAYYARLWMKDNPEHAGFFKTSKVQQSMRGVKPATD